MMNNVKRLLLTLGVTFAVAAAYFAGAARTVTEAKPAPRLEPPLQATPADITVRNPTAVLLGEETVPPEALRSAVTPAPDLIVPVIPK